MLRWGAAPIIILVNNASYVIEEMIHRGEGYNALQARSPWVFQTFAGQPFGIRACEGGRDPPRGQRAATIAPSVEIHCRPSPAGPLLPCGAQCTARGGSITNSAQLNQLKPSPRRPRTQVWDYIGFAKSLHNGQGKLWTALAKTEAQLAEALAGAAERPDHLCFIEAHTRADDCRWADVRAAALLRCQTVESRGCLKCQELQPPYSTSIIVPWAGDANPHTLHSECRRCCPSCPAPNPTAPSCSSLARGSPPRTRGPPTPSEPQQRRGPLGMRAHPLAFSRGSGDRGRIGVC